MLFPRNGHWLTAWTPQLRAEGSVPAWPHRSAAGARVGASRDPASLLAWLVLRLAGPVATRLGRRASAAAPAWPRHAFSWSCLTPLRGAVLACAVLLTGLFAANSASAQTTIWEATLTPGEYTIGGETNTGFIGVGTDLAGTLSDTDFVYDGVTYTIDEISRRHSNGQLDLTFAGCCTVLPDVSSSWILESAGTQIAIKDLESSLFFPSIYRASGAPNWQDGQAVTVRIFSPGVPPSAVRSLTARAGNQQVHVTWDRPETIGEPGVYLLHYEYQRKDGSGPWSEWIESPAQTQAATGFTLKGLDNGTEYSFRVRLINTQRLAGTGGDTVSATPQATYRLNHTRWGIRRGGKGTRVTLSVGGGPFRGTQTYTLHWNGNPVNQAPLHADNPTTMVLPAGQTQVTVQIRAAADADGADKVYNPEVQYPLVARQSGTEVVRTRQSGLYDGNLSVHDNEPEPVASLEAPELVEEGEFFRLRVRFSHRLDRDADIGFGFSNPSRAKWNLTGVPDPRVITIPAGDLVATTGLIRKPDNADKDRDTEITFVLSLPARDDPWKLSDSAKTVRINDDETPESDYRRGPWLRIGPASGRESGDGSDTSMRFRVNLDDKRTTQTTVSVDYRTVDKTARAGSDYVAASGTLTFAAGEKSKEFDVTIKDDQVEDNGETFEIRLENPTGGGRIHPYKGKTTGTITNTEASVLSATFPSSRFASATHSGGDDLPQVIVEFSEAIAAIDKSTPSVTITGGAIASVQSHAEDGLDHAYIFWVTPEGKADVTFTLVPNAACDANGICTAAGTPLTEVPRARTIPGPGDSSGSNLSELSMNDTEASEEDDATIDFVVRLDPARTETVTVDYATSNGSASAGDDYTAKSGTLTFGPGETSKTVAVPILDDTIEENDETLTVTLSNASAAEIKDTTATGTIEDDEADPATPVALTASFSGVPASHTGEEFTFGLTFSENVELSYLTLRDTALSASGGTVRKARRRQQGSNQGWTITVAPAGNGSVSISLSSTSDCDSSGAICTADGRGLSHSLSASVAGPVGISVADARVEEGDGAVLAFAVTLSRAASGTVTLDYATADGTATAGLDYTAASGTLTFEAGNRSQTVSVTVLDDSHDDGGETMTLRLSNASGGVLTDSSATGTIENKDPMPRAFMARFGRTAAVHVVEQVQERIEAPREAGFEARFAGRQLRPAPVDEMAVEFFSQFAPQAGFNRGGGGGHHSMPATPAGGAPPPGTGGPAGRPGMGAADDRFRGSDPMGGTAGPGGGLDRRGHFGGGYGGGSLGTGSGFVMNRETGRGGTLSFWSRGAGSQFYGREGEISLDGRVRTAMAGADYRTGPLVAGLSVSHSRGQGGYSGVDVGDVTSSVTGLYPWLGYRATDRISVWGVSGYGKGALALTPGEGAALTSGLSMAMAAGGMRSELADSVVGGFGLALKADALWVETGIEGMDGPQGRLGGTEAAVSRLRTGLEASRGYSFQRGLSLNPTLEVGIRRDAGDAETGAGVDVGGGLVVSDRLTGLSADLRVRMLVAHQEEGFRERGVSVSFSYNPTPRTPLGLVAKVTPSWGGQAEGGTRALWGQQAMAGMPYGGMATGSRLEAELGYGLPVGRRLVGTPRFAVGTSSHGRDYRLGYGMRVAERGALSFELGVDAHRRQRSAQMGGSQGVGGRLTARW